MKSDERTVPLARDEKSLLGEGDSLSDPLGSSSVAPEGPQFESTNPMRLLPLPEKTLSSLTDLVAATLTEAL